MIHFRGATAMMFSSKGFYLAAGTKKEKTCPIIVLSVLKRTKVATLDGSTGIINEIRWSKNDE